MKYSSFDTLANRYDAVVIGSGLGGMTCANRLANAGHSVLLLEQETDSYRIARRLNETTFFLGFPTTMQLLGSHWPCL